MCEATSSCRLGGEKMTSVSMLVITELLCPTTSLSSSPTVTASPNLYSVHYITLQNNTVQYLYSVQASVEWWK